MPEIRSHGPPPESNADRMIGEMLRLTIQARTKRSERIRDAMSGAPDASAAQAGTAWCRKRHL